MLTAKEILENREQKDMKHTAKVADKISRKVAKSKKGYIVIDRESPWYKRQKCNEEQLLDTMCKAGFSVGVSTKSECIYISVRPKFRISGADFPLEKWTPSGFSKSENAD